MEHRPQRYVEQLVDRRLHGETIPDELSITAVPPLAKDIKPGSAMTEVMIETALRMDEQITWLKEAVADKEAFGEKCLALYMLLNQWLSLKQKGVRVSDWFVCRNIKKIAIYGMHFVGERLCDELLDEEVMVSYGIDRQIVGKYRGICILPEVNDAIEVEAIVVTPITFYAEIKEALEASADCPVISIKDILSDCEGIEEKQVCV